MKNSVEITEIDVSIKVLVLGKKTFTKSIFNQLKTTYLKNLAQVFDEEVLGYVLVRFNYNDTNYDKCLLTIKNGQIYRYVVCYSRLENEQDYYNVDKYGQIFITS